MSNHFRFDKFHFLLDLLFPHLRCLLLVPSLGVIIRFSCLLRDNPEVVRVKYKTLHE